MLCQHGWVSLRQLLACSTGNRSRLGVPVFAIISVKRGLFPSLWEGLGEGAKLDRDMPSPQPSPKGRGSKDSESIETLLS